jgi:uridine kinase
MKECRSVHIPNYSFVEHQRTDETTYLYGANVIIGEHLCPRWRSLSAFLDTRLIIPAAAIPHSAVEGIFVLYDKNLRDLLDLKIFVQCDSDLMLARRLRRDLVERGRDAAGVLDQYLRFVKPAFDNFIQPTNRFADIIVPGANNERSVDMIVSHVRRQLSERRRELRGTLYKETAPGGPSSVPSTPGVEKCEHEGGLYYKARDQGEVSEQELLPDTVHLIKQTAQIKVSADPLDRGDAMTDHSGMQGIHTLLRDVETDPEDFIFLANRLSTLVIEHALSLLPYREKRIETPLDLVYAGAELDVPEGHLCGVSILRSGASLEKGLRRVVRDVPVGSVLIQSDTKTGEPLLYQVSLPEILTTSFESAEKSTVLLLDSQIGTGAAALMAVRILLDHGVREENIVFCCILVSKVGGVWALKRAFRESRAVDLLPGAPLLTFSSVHLPSRGTNCLQCSRQRPRRALGERDRWGQKGSRVPLSTVPSENSPLTVPIPPDLYYPPRSWIFRRPLLPIRSLLDPCAGSLSVAFILPHRIRICIVVLFLSLFGRQVLLIVPGVCASDVTTRWWEQLRDSRVEGSRLFL